MVDPTSLYQWESQDLCTVTNSKEQTLPCIYTGIDDFNLVLTLALLPSCSPSCLYLLILIETQCHILKCKLLSIWSQGLKPVNSESLKIK